MNRACEVCDESFEVTARKPRARFCTRCRVWWWYWSRGGSLSRWSNYTKRVERAARRVHFRQASRRRARVA